MLQTAPGVGVVPTFPRPGPPSVVVKIYALAVAMLPTMLEEDRNPGRVVGGAVTRNKVWTAEQPADPVEGRELLSPPNQSHCQLSGSDRGMRRSIPR